MSDNIKFYISLFEIFIFSFFMISIDFIIIKSKSFNIHFFDHFDTFPLYGMNYISLYLFIILYRCIKIHKIAKNYTYSDILSVLKENRNAKKDNIFSYSTINTNNDKKYIQNNYFQKYILYYVWMRNQNCQNALHIFSASGIFITLHIVGYIPDYFIFFVCGLFFWGIVKFFQGTVEIV